MATQQVRRNSIYGYPTPQAGLQQEPIVAQRDPLTNDFAEIGTIWCNTTANSFFILTSTTNGIATWTATTGGATTLTSLTVNPGNVVVTAGNLTLNAGNVTAAAGTGTFGTLDAGNSTVNGTLDVTGATTVTDLTVSGDFVATGDFDITDTASISLTSTNNAAGAITLTTNGGTAETLLIRSLQGTGTGAVTVSSTAGGVNITGGLATINAVNIHASNAAGGISAAAGTAGITLAATNGPVNVTSGTGAINIGTDAAHVVTVGNILGAGQTLVESGTGGVDITSTGTITATSTGILSATSNANSAGAVSLIADGGTSETILINAMQGTSATSVNIVSDTGGITLTAATDIAETATNAITLQSGAGGTNIGSTSQVIVTSLGNVAGSITIDANGGINETILIQSTLGTSTTSIDMVSLLGGITITGATAITQTSAGDVSLLSTNNAAGAISLQVNGGTSETLLIESVQGTSASAIDIVAVAGGITLEPLNGALRGVPVSGTSATTTVVANGRLFVAEFTGLTTAAGVTETLTVTNSAFTAGTQGVLVTVSNAGTNDAQMSLTRVNTQTAGSLVIQTINNGAAALNGNLYVTGWLLD